VCTGIGLDEPGNLTNLKVDSTVVERLHHLALAELALQHGKRNLRKCSICVKSEERLWMTHEVATLGERAAVASLHGLLRKVLGGERREKRRELCLGFL